MEIAARLDHYGRPAWIFVMVLGFIIFWPIGLAILAYLIWSGRMGGWKHGGRGRWHYYSASDDRASGESTASLGWGWGCGPRHHHRRARAGASTGNRAFDEYREETLRRLEDEQEEFQGFLERLRQAKDKAEFDDFMDERQRKTVDPEADGKSEGPEAAPAG